MAQTIEGQEVMAVIKAHPELFEIGNHTMHHCDLVRGRRRLADDGAVRRA